MSSRHSGPVSSFRPETTKLTMPYRAIDCDGNLVDTMLSEHRDMATAQAFFRSAKSVTDVTPDRVTTDGHGSYPRAIRSTLGRRVVHRTAPTGTTGWNKIIGA